MNILFLSNPTKEQSVRFCRDLSERIARHGNTVCLGKEEVPFSPDLIVIAGGDGTVLRYVSTIRRFGAPVLGINFGHRGYLTSCEPEEAQEKILSICAGNGVCEDRRLLDGEILDAEGKTKQSFTALNEAVLCRGGICRALPFSVAINGSHVTSLSADGVIVSTATGSTAYNYSAGGPILMPEAKSLVLTPICASSLLRSSIVTGETDKITLTFDASRLGGDDELPQLVADGYAKYGVARGDSVQLRLSAETLRIFGGSSGSFLTVLGQKML